MAAKRAAKGAAARRDKKADKRTSKGAEKYEVTMHLPLDMIPERPKTYVRKGTTVPRTSRETTTPQQQLAFEVVQLLSQILRG